MAGRDRPITVKDTIHKLQLHLLEGINDERRLFAAGSLMSRNDYQDVVTERSIAGMCGYPLCSNSLPSERSRKGRYRISLKEHKVYDLHETYLYCSTSCVVNSRAFGGSLQEERCSVLNSAKLNEVLRLFEGVGLNGEEDFGRDGDLGMSKLKIQENSGLVDGVVSMEAWVGPSNAIEGYVPLRDHSSSRSKNRKEGSKSSQSMPNKGETMIFNEMDFMSTIISQDEYGVAKIPLEKSKTVSNSKSKNSSSKADQKEINDRCTTLSASCTPARRGPEAKHKPNEGEGRAVTIDELIISERVGSCTSADDVNAMESEKEVQVGKEAETSSTMLRSSLKSSDCMRATRSVTWADEKTDCTGNINLCQFSESKDRKKDVTEFDATNMRDADNALRYASAEACAVALSQAAESVASGESDVADAVAEAGITVLAPPHEVHGACYEENVDAIDPKPAQIKWPSKTGISESDFFDSEDSWFDSPPEGFNLTGGLLDTMSFLDPLPPFRVKQWQVIVLLFIDALSISHIPALTPHLISRRRLFQKAFDSAQISAEEYEVMKELVIPLGRVPQFSAQNGG